MSGNGTNDTNLYDDIDSVINEFHMNQTAKLLKIYFDGLDTINVSNISNILSPKLTRSDLINKYFGKNHLPRRYVAMLKNNSLFQQNVWRPFYHINREVGSYYRKYYHGIETYSQTYAMGWPTTTLFNVLRNPFVTNMSSGEDIMFNLYTILFEFDYYLLPEKLGIYCGPT